MKNILNYKSINEEFHLENRRLQNEEILKDLGFNQFSSRNYSYNPEKNVQLISKHLVEFNSVELEFVDILDISMPEDSLVLKSLECLDTGKKYDMSISLNKSVYSNNQLMHLKEVLSKGISLFQSEVSKKIETIEELLLPHGFVGFGGITPTIFNDSESIRFVNNESTFYLALKGMPNGRQGFAVSNLPNWNGSHSFSVTSFGKFFDLKTNISDIISYVEEIVQVEETELDFESIEAGYNWAANL